MKTILVIGATGAQGGSVARHLLRRGESRVRALTRRPDSAAAQSLASLGAEVVHGDLDDRASLRAALKGCEGVFGVTNYWEHFDRELEHGHNLINAVAGSEVEHFVFSSLPGVAKATNGELKAPHFDLKHELELYARSLELPATFVHVAFYYENFLGFFPPRLAADGAYRFGFPQGETPLAAVGIEDCGAIVATIFEHPEVYVGQTVGIVGDDRPPAQYASVLSGVVGKQVVYSHVPREEFAAYPFPGADDLADMFDYNRRFIPNRRHDLEQCRLLHPSMQTFEQWASAQRAALGALLG